MKQIRLLLVDDHVVVRKGLVHVLENFPEIDIVGEAESGEEALYKTRTLTPDVVLMDVKMDGLGGIKTTELITESNPDIRVVGLSTFADRATIDAMIAAGASGFLEKAVSVSELVQAIRQAYDGNILDYPEHLNKTAAQNEMRPDNEIEEFKPDLGEKQQNVLRLLVKGFTNPEIAEQMGFSIPTARYHVSVILQKLEVSNRSEAAALAVRDRLVD